MDDTVLSERDVLATAEATAVKAFDETTEIDTATCMEDHFDSAEAFYSAPWDEHVPEAWCRDDFGDATAAPTPLIPTTRAELDAMTAPESATAAAPRRADRSA